jgi:hypothetical protein
MKAGRGLWSDQSQDIMDGIIERTYGKEKYHHVLFDGTKSERTEMFQKFIKHRNYKIACSRMNKYFVKEFGREIRESECKQHARFAFGISRNKF